MNKLDEACYREQKEIISWYFCQIERNFSENIRELSEREPVYVAQFKMICCVSKYSAVFLWPPQKMNFPRKLTVIISDISIYEPTAFQSKCTISPSCDEALFYANLHNQQHQFAAHDPMCPKHLFTCGHVGFNFSLPFSPSLTHLSATK